MIITRTPLRISFVGGGTDLKSFYQLEPGAVVSMTIDKYVYVAVNRKFDRRIRVSYSITEIAEKVSRIRHDIVREGIALSGVSVSRGLEVVTVADVPSHGTGLGSSSALAVGLLLALHQLAHPGQLPPTEDALAKQACTLEIDRCGKPIGKQDQYAAAFGGLNMIRFYPDGNVEVLPVEPHVRLLEKLMPRLLLLFIGGKRDSDKILAEQNGLSSKHVRTYRKMADLAEQMYSDLCEGNIDAFGDFLHENWMYKKELSSGISNPEIDALYEKARRLGAKGGKVLGAGGGGSCCLWRIFRNMPK